MLGLVALELTPILLPGSCVVRVPFNACTHDRKWSLPALAVIARCAYHTDAAFASCRPAPPQLGELVAAVDDYTAALAVDPQSSYAHYNRGITKDRLQVGGGPEGCLKGWMCD